MPSNRVSLALLGGFVGLTMSAVACAEPLADVEVPMFYPIGMGQNGYYYNPLDDSFDCPAGYGEYAEYGPWASRNYGAAYRPIVRRARTYYGRRVLVVRYCR